ncbi:MAG: carbon-nitrogen family hydrolase [Acidobacteriota bacterium]
MPAPPSSSLKVAALQYDIAWEDPAKNFERLRPFIEGAATLGADLLLLPEMFACGFSMATERIAEPPDGPSTEFLRLEAERCGLFLGGSVPELPAAEEASGGGEDPRPSNSFLLAGPGGELHRYRKIHPFTYAGEHEHYRAGESPVTVEIQGLRCSLFVCYDLRFADEFWAVARDTDAYLVVANWPEPRRAHWRTLIDARAIENQAYVVGVNRVGRGGRLNYTGDSRIVDPRGEVLQAAAGGETLLFATLEGAEVAKTRREFPFLDDRRG